MSWRNPVPTVDVVIEYPGGIVLIRRRNPPHGWALPGGFVDEGERVEDAARREVLEETGLEVELTALLYVYSDPARDPRRHTMSVVFVARPLPGGAQAPTAGDDAAEAVICDPRRPPGPLAFDHGDIVAAYLSWRETGAPPSPARR